MLRPEREVLESVLFVFEDLLLKRGDMLVPPVISDLLQAQLRTHRRPLGRPALLPVKRNDAPRDEVVSRENCSVQRLWRVLFYGVSLRQIRQCEHQS